MSDKPVILSEQEQIQLMDLEKSGNDFLDYKNIILRSNFSGNDAPGVIHLVKFLDSLINQTVTQINNLKLTAKARANEPKKEESNGQETK